MLIQIFLSYIFKIILQYETIKILYGKKCKVMIEFNLQTNFIIIIINIYLMFINLAKKFYIMYLKKIINLNIF